MKEAGKANLNDRKLYQAPRLVRVALVPEEATMVSCKTNSIAGPGGASWKCTGIPAACSHSGS